MTTFEDIVWEQHPSGLGFQAELDPGNNFKALIVCGPAVYGKTNADIEEKASAADYTTFEFWIAKPLDYLPPEEQNWVGPVNREQLMGFIADLYSWPWVDGWNPGGMGVPEGAGPQE